MQAHARSGNRGRQGGVPKNFWTVAGIEKETLAMSEKLSAGRVRATYEFIKANRGEHAVQMMCRLLGVAPSGLRL